MKLTMLLLTLLLMFPVASFANGDFECRNINAHAALVSEGSEGCEFDSTTYDYCYFSKIWGNLNGSWTTYVMDDWYEILEDLGVDTPDQADESWYNREFEVFTTKHGRIWGTAQFVFELPTFFESNGGITIPTMVQGGTEKYEDASGWISLIFTDATFTNWRVYGRVCGPNIED